VETPPCVSPWRVPSEIALYKYDAHLGRGTFISQMAVLY